MEECNRILQYYTKRLITDSFLPEIEVSSRRKMPVLKITDKALVYMLIGYVIHSSYKTLDFDIS
jgi:hypothetical protein